MNSTTENVPTGSDPSKEEMRQNLRRIRVAPLVVVFLCFLLPFLKISCVLDHSMSQSVSGTTFAFGGEIKSKDGDTHKVKAEPWAMVALVLTTIALGFMCGTSRTSFNLAAAFSGATILSLIILQEVVRAEIRRQSEGALTIRPDIGFILATVALLASAAIAIYVRPKVAQPKAEVSAEAVEASA